MRKADLVRALEGVPRHPAPRAELEQYATPAAIAADLLLAAHKDGAIDEKRVLDLGCGTGVFTIGAALLGARLATGIDVDTDAISVARQAALAARVEQRTWFLAGDLTDWRPEPGTFDTVVMNPPFGAQAANRRGDRLFYERAAQAVRPAGTVWFLAQENSERFLSTFVHEHGGALEKVGSWDYPLQATMPHHERDVKLVRVGGYRMAWPSN